MTARSKNIRHEDNASDSLQSRIALSRVKGINLSTAKILLGRVGSPENFFTLGASALSASTGLPSSVTDQVYRSNIYDKAAEECRFVRDKAIKAMFCADDGYPRRLLECDDAPAMLYSIGRCNLDCLHSVAIVGTRHATPYGIDFVRNLVADLAASLDSLIIISGLAYGIDVAAHKAALEHGVPTVAVVAHGLNTIYPSDHRAIAARIINEQGSIVTEYTSADAIHKGNFLARNRIMAGLADVVIVVESDMRGGAMTTARIASAYNREVMAVPGRVTDTYSRGCNSLIADCTARIVRSAEDVFNAMNWQMIPTEESQTELSFTMSPEQQTVADYIISHPDHTINDICVGLSIPYNILSAMLFDMEMSDVILTLPGGRFAVKAHN